VASYIEHHEPPAAPAPGPVRPIGLLRECASGLELLRLGWRSQQLRRMPSGDGAPVIVIPGWQAPEATMAPLRRFLRRKNYAAEHWGLGVNRGDPEGDSERLATRVEALAARHGRSVALVGWSLGGVVARETARRVPARVAAVVTFGSPAVGGPTHTIAARSYGEDVCAEIEARQEALDAESPINVPVVAIFSRRDGIVSWPACIDRISPQVTHFEVRSTHLGLGVDPSVWRIVGEQLHRFTRAQAA
jgi:pimeloyl-ACP methyl ester carboxylesterase